MSRRASRAPGVAGTSPQALALRAAGLNATSARLAVLRVAPQLFASGTALDIKALHRAVHSHGYVVSRSALHRVLADLARAGLLPARTGARGGGFPCNRNKSDTR